MAERDTPGSVDSGEDDLDTAQYPEATLLSVEGKKREQLRATEHDDEEAHWWRGSSPRS